MTDKDYLKIAIEQTKKSVEADGFPAGAIVVKNGEIISRGISVGFKLNDPTSHAESASIREACDILHTSNLDGAVLYAALQPCVMCFSVANWAGISKIVYGCKKIDEMAAKGYYEGLNNIGELNEKNNRKIELEYIAYFENEILDLIKEWESNNLVK